MNRPTFSSPLAAAMFSIGQSALPTPKDYEEALAGVPVGEPDADFDRWCDAREDGRIYNIQDAPP